MKREDPAYARICLMYAMLDPERIKRHQWPERAKEWLKYSLVQAAFAGVDEEYGDMPQRLWFEEADVLQPDEFFTMEVDDGQVLLKAKVQFPFKPLLYHLKLKFIDSVTSPTRKVIDVLVECDMVEVIQLKAHFSLGLDSSEYT